MSTRDKGRIGEDAVCDFLTDKGFRLLSRNYLRKWGELDIVAEKDNKLHFFEVKSVSVPLVRDGRQDLHRPEENVDERKATRLKRTIRSYLVENRGSEEVEFYFHVICVHMSEEREKTTIKWIENVIL